MAYVYMLEDAIVEKKLFFCRRTQNGWSNPTGGSQWQRILFYFELIFLLV